MEKNQKKEYIYILFKNGILKYHCLLAFILALESLCQNNFCFFLSNISCLCDHFKTLSLSMVFYSFTIKFQV